MTASNDDQVFVDPASKKAVSSIETGMPVIPGYEIRAVLTSQPLHAVYRANEVASNTSVDLTVLKRAADADPARWEAACAQYGSLLLAQRQLSQNRNIQQVLNFGTLDNLFYVIREPVEGRTLRQILNTEGPRPIAWVMPLLSQLSAALDYAASYQFYHTALTPERIVVSTDGQRVWILDFALARFRRPAGSPYTAPELLVRSGDQSSVDKSHTDMYSLGTILYECLSGRVAFSGATDNEICHNIVNSVPRPLLDQPLYVREIVARMMMRLPEARYRTFIDVTTDLELQRRPPTLKAADVSTIPLEIKLNNLKLAAPPLVETVIANPPRVTGPGLLAHRIQQLWKLINSGLTLRRAAPAAQKTVPKEIVPKAPASTQEQGEAEDGSLLWGLLNRVLPSNFFTGRTDRVAPGPTENPAAYRYSERWHRMAKKMRRFVRRTCIATLLVCLALAAHAAMLLNRKPHAVVTKLKGHPTVQLRAANGKPGPIVALHVGDQVEAERLPVITTDTKSDVTLEMPGTRLKISPDAAVRVDQMSPEPDGGHQIELLHGQVWANCNMATSATPPLEIHSGNAEVQEIGTACSVEAIPGGVRAIAYQGSVKVSNGLARKTVEQDREINVLEEHRLPDTSPLKDETRQDLMQQEAGLQANIQEADTWLGRLSDAYHGIQTTAVEPLVGRGLTLAHLRPAERLHLEDGAAQIVAIHTLSGFATALMYDGEPIPDLNLQTLEETGMKEEDRNNILNNFENHRLLYYKPNGDGYILFARANDSRHTLLKLENGKVQTIAEWDEEKLLSPLLPK